MNGATLNPCARLVDWMLRRNPLYLISAVLMAVGARLFLVDETVAAGDVELILLTLGVLQAYVWMIGAILLLLYRTDRAPEDRPSLLLVATLFWTGPMAATMEMTATRPLLGTCLAAGACLIATSELLVVCRTLRIEVSAAARLAGIACAVLIAAAPPFVAVRQPYDGRNELYLYAAWWVAAAIPLLLLGSRRDRATTLRHDLLVVGITVWAVALHLAGMNHAFYCHASAFYAAPVLIAVGAVGVALIPPGDRRHKTLLVLLALLPAGAVWLCARPFHEAVPIHRLTWWFHDPMVPVLVASATVWWYGFARHRHAALLHTGSAAVAFALLRVVGVSSAGNTLEHWHIVATSVPELYLWIAMYTVVIYLMVVAALRRSRTHVLLALMAHAVGIALLTWNRCEMAVLIVSLLCGWSAVVAVLIAGHRMHVIIRLLPIALLAIATWLLEPQSDMGPTARAHAIVAPVALFAIGSVWRWSRYRSAAGVWTGLVGLAIAVRLIDGHPDPTAGLVVAGAFALLLGGGLVSWYKSRLLESIRREQRVDLPEQTRPFASPLEQ